MDKQLTPFKELPIKWQRLSNQEKREYLKIMSMDDKEFLSQLKNMLEAIVLELDINEILD